MKHFIAFVIRATEVGLLQEGRKRARKKEEEGGKDGERRHPVKSEF